MSAADDVIVAARKRVGEKTPNDEYCATFVSQVFAAAGQGKVFGSSSSVAGIAGHFSGAQVSTGMLTLGLADLAVFGENDHIMIYSGNGRVIGTSEKAGANGKGIPGTTTVVEVSIGSVQPPFSKALHTGLAVAEERGNFINPTDPFHVEAIVPAIFGDMFGWVPTFTAALLVVVVAAVLAYEGAKMVLESET